MRRTNELGLPIYPIDLIILTKLIDHVWLIDLNSGDLAILSSIEDYGRSTFSEVTLQCPAANLAAL